KQFDQVTVAVLINSTKSGLFSIEERVALLRECTSQYPNITVDTFEGLLADYCTSHNINAIVKGLRAVSDFDYELQMAQMNSKLGVDTFFVATNPEFSFLSSSMIKEVAKFAGDVSGLVPPVVQKALTAKFTAQA
ncbi:MAG: pantetheine-phosphate adenylyltransferase, partial [Actinobacteria bacterium]|nr:pantetheine-phosphate adenylyltransferase [Actinomycetota bacterium]